MKKLVSKPLGKNNVGKPPKLPFIGTAAQGNKLRLDTFNDQTFGFLRVTVTAASVKGEFVAVDVASNKARVLDKFTLGLNRHTVS